MPPRKSSQPATSPKPPKEAKKAGRSTRGRLDDGSANPIDVHVGARIRLRRTLLGMSQEKLGECLGLTFQQVQKYEKGANRISASRLYFTAKILGVPVQFFFEELPGVEEHGGMGEGREEDAVLSALMNVEGVTLAKAFRDADSVNKRKLISTIARVIAETKE